MLPAERQGREGLIGSYFVAAYPPFSAWTPEANPALIEALERPASGDAALGLYLHVPFCAKKCDYCYYLSYTGQKRSTIDAYVNAVIREAGIYGRRAAVLGRPLRYVYVGGGTPSILNAEEIHCLVEGLRVSLDWSQVEEFTFEVAPMTVRPALLDALKAAGVSRVSMGVQSFDDDLLKLNGRIHLRADVVNAIGALKKKGFDYLNLDLMAGLLGETPESFKQSVREAIRWEPESITVYQMEIPTNTRLYREYASNRLAFELASWDEKRDRLDFAFNEMDRAGYHVISAYTAVKDPRKHRFLYQEYLWGGADMLALGVAAFGYMGGVHYQNCTNLESYGAALEKDVLPIRRSYPLSAEDRLVREFILQLKRGEVDRDRFERKFGVKLTDYFRDELKDLEAEGLITVTPLAIRLTADGLLRADALLPVFYDTRFHDVPYW